MAGMENYLAASPLAALNQGLDMILSQLEYGFGKFNIEWLNGDDLEVSCGQSEPGGPVSYSMTGEGPLGRVSYHGSLASTRAYAKYLLPRGDGEPSLYYEDGNRFPLYIGRGRQNAIHEGTEFVGANCMSLNNRPSAANLANKYVYLHSELRNGRAPRAYHVNGLHRWLESGHRNNPFTRASLRTSNMRRVVPT